MKNHLEEGRPRSALGNGNWKLGLLFVGLFSFSPSFSSTHICHAHHHHIEVLIIVVEVVIVIVVIVIIIIVVVVIVVALHAHKDRHEHLDGGDSHSEVVHEDTLWGAGGPALTRPRSARQEGGQRRLAEEPLVHAGPSLRLVQWQVQTTVQDAAHWR